MNSRMRTAVSDAMALLKSADVTGATAAIQRALTGQASDERERPPAGEANSVGFRAPRRRKLGEVIAALRSGPMGVAQAGRPATAGDESDERFMTRNYRGAAGSVTYKLYVPADQEDRELALVLMMHGCTQDPDDFARGTRMNRLADEFGLIVAYPHQPRTANAQGCWNWFDPRHQQRGSGEPAVLAGLAQELAGAFKVAPERVFAAGLSAGGAMADILASAYPEIFSAVGIHSGVPVGAAHDVMSAFAAMKGTAKAGPAAAAKTVARRIIFHGAADLTVNPSNGQDLLARARMQEPGATSTITSETVNGRKAKLTRLGRAGASALAEHWLVDGGAHAWSGGDAAGSFADAKGPDASREMVRFFLNG